MGGTLVREARLRAGLTQAELARRAGTTQSSIARLESGRTSPAFDTVRRLIRLCGLDLHVELHDHDPSDLAHLDRGAGRSAEDLLAELTRTTSRLEGLRRRAAVVVPA